jgi:hypothetical protein
LPVTWNFASGRAYQPFEFVIPGTTDAQTRWFATSGTGNRFGNPSDSGSI